MRNLLATLLVAMATAPTAHGQGVIAPAVPRLDEKGTSWGSIFNEGGMAIVGDNCQLLRVQTGEIWGIAASMPKQTPVLEMVDGARCIFARETEHLPRLTAAAPDNGGVAYIRVDRPGFYSVRVTAEGAERAARVMLVASKLEK
ncbi:MAG: hypothetical protein QM773_01845 [Hyphomonadaceae bacterium]